MKKIININLSGRVIPIEDSAYEKLKGYIDSLRRYFANEDGRDEIINDIESRIAELMNEIVRKGAAHVTDADIESIIVSMGRPEDFDAQAEADEQAKSTGSKGGQQYSYSERKSRGRLYRDTSDKVIGGVCSGVAAYLNTDPAIVRILFAIVTLGGFGLGFLLYILLWMILPTKDLESYGGKRLYRNPDDRVIGGVAGGLAAYFNRETWVIRLIFAAPFLLSIFFGFLRGVVWHFDFDFFPNVFFGSVSSTFVLAYIVLWVVLPEARSTYEKMEMRGEKVDVNRIRQNVQEGMGNVKDRANQWADEVKETAQHLGEKAKQFGERAKDYANTRGKSFSRDVSDVAGRSGRGLGHAIGVLFKVFIFFIAGSIAFGLFVGLMALLFGGIAWWPVNNFLWTSKWQQIYAWSTLFFFFVVPLIAFITWVVRRMTRARSRSGYLGWTFGCLWAIGWVAAILFATSVAKDFREYENTGEQTLEMAQPSHGRLVVGVSAPELEYTGSFGWMNDGDEGWDLSNDTIRLSTIKFTVEKSLDSNFHVMTKRYAFGRTEEEARDRAAAIQYKVAVNDSLLDLGNGYAVGKENKFRGQQVEVIIQVPAGKKIRFDGSLRNKLNPSDFNLRTSRQSRRNIRVRVNDHYQFPFKSDVDYVMDTDGELKDPGGNTIVPKRYRYENDNPAISDSLELKRQIEEEKRRQLESEQRIKELEERQKKVKPSSTNTEKMEDADNDVAIAGSTSPVFSLVRWF